MLKWRLFYKRFDDYKLFMGPWTNLYNVHIKNTLSAYDESTKAQ